MKRRIRVDFVDVLTRTVCQSVEFDEDVVDHPSEWIRYALRQKSRRITILSRVPIHLIHPNDVEWVRNDEIDNTLIFALECHTAKEDEAR